MIKNQNILYTSPQIILYGYEMSKFLLTSDFKSIDPKEFEQLLEECCLSIN